jgi:Arc/MetJ-type ribon-helix-helix transcriptional regulator
LLPGCLQVGACLQQGSRLSAWLLKMLFDRVSHKRYIASMKTATIPPIRIEPSFREEIEQSLDSGETMAALVENAVRTEVSRRREQSEFVRRGLAAIARSEADGDWISAETVIAKLEAKVVAARERQKKFQQ